MEKNSLPEIVNKETRLQGIGNRVVNELELLPYELLAATGVYFFGGRIGEHISRNYFPVPPNNFIGNLQGYQDYNVGFAASFIFLIPALVAARYIGKYVNKKLQILMH